MTRQAPLIMFVVLPLLGACANADAPSSLRAATAGAGTDSDLRQRCTAEAERVVVFRERGQAVRDDDAMFMTDATNNIPTLRVQSDAYNRRSQREDLIRECIRTAQAGPQPVDAATPTPTTRGRRN
ncbi:hypothetical protein GXW78_25940 [Roseomonas terrae]|jgi:hypothetical protein|uniref:Lipoprotein n=1 Tax=Neoroseomonas terrae TaxID=424799 RepID=A0ABS5EQ28_9PROT|nr:hypothetical protein [Neoroseomonas terrae]MBR0653124.1 hypothetical protein [Neoroseomonas terrae]